MVAIFKYFSEEAHARAFIDRGKLLMRPLSYFRALEEDGGRADRRDGILTYAPAGGLELNMSDGKKVTLEDGSFNSSVQQNDIFLFCASREYSVELTEKFGRFCVEIDPDYLVRRLKQRAHPSSKFDYENIIHGTVEYRTYDRVPGVDWALPEKLVFIKPEDFSAQSEYRIALGKRGAFAIENVALTLQTGPCTTSVKPEQSHIILPIGGLKQAATLHLSPT